MPNTQPEDLSSVAMEECNALEKLHFSRKRIRTLSKLLECPICLDHFDNPQQLVCGHVFCKRCVEGTMRMKLSRCGICKEKVTRRNFRDAPIDYTNLLTDFLAIRNIVDSFLPPEEEEVAPVMQGVSRKTAPLHVKGNETGIVSLPSAPPPDPLTPTRAPSSEPKSAVPTPSTASKIIPTAPDAESTVSEDDAPCLEVSNPTMSGSLQADTVNTALAQAHEPEFVVASPSNGSKSLSTGPVIMPAVIGNAPPRTEGPNLSLSRDLSTPARDSSDSQPLPPPVQGSPSSRTPNHRKRKKSSSRPTPMSKRSRRVSSAKKPPLAGKYVLCATGLNGEQKNVLGKVAATKVVTVKQDIGPRVTHVVCNALESVDSPTRTLKLCKAIASGLPILCYKWIEDVADCAVLPDVDEYCHRYTRSENNLFADCFFYFGNLGEKMATNRDELAAIVRLGGGVILKKEPTGISSRASEKYFIVEDASTNRRARRSSLASFAERAPGVRIIEPTWILDQCTPN